MLQMDFYFRGRKVDYPGIGSIGTSAEKILNDILK